MYGYGREILASTTETASGNSSAIALDNPSNNVSIGIDVTASGGASPTLDLTVEWTHDGTTWLKGDPADAFSQITGATSVVKTFPVRATQIRLVWTIGGTTPSFTFSASAYAIG